jgi:hypothetical protein
MELLRKDIAGIALASAALLCTGCATSSAASSSEADLAPRMESGMASGTCRV